MTIPSPDDYLSPMLVKELRQGMRGYIFLFAFLAIQGFMFLAVFLDLISQSAAGNEVGSFLFWAVISIPLLALVPLRGVNGISSEIKAKTLELILLTKMNAWSIVAGKWFALFSQSLLFVSAVLPYLLLRYFLGGINVISELQSLVVLLLISAFLTAATVGISSFTSWWVRLLLVAGLVIAVIAAMNLLAAVALFSFVSGSEISSGIWVAVCFQIVIAMLILLEYGAAQIAPPAENHAMSKRLLALLFGTVGLLAYFTFGDSALILLFLSLLALFATGVAAISEEAVYLPSIARPFARFGPAGLLAGRFLYPSPLSGTLFIMAVTLALAYPLYSILLNFGTKLPLLELTICTLIGFTGAIIVPAALVRLVVPGTARPFLFWCLFQIILVTVFWSVYVSDSFSDTQLAHFLAFVPTCLLFLLPSDDTTPAQLPNFAIQAAVVLAVALAYLLWHWRRDVGYVFRMEHDARLAIASRS